jgi:hypothetical protein
LAAHTGAALPYAIRDWNEAVRAIQETFPGGLAIIDEFPYLLSLGEAKWGEVMGLGHLDRLRRARDLLSVKGHHAADAVLACYSGAGFTAELTDFTANDRHVLLVDLTRLFQET